MLPLFVILVAAINFEII